MELELHKVVPGMILQKDIYGKSGKLIFEKNTELTEEHITFLNKFLIEKVAVSPLFEEETIGADAHTKSISLNEMKRNAFIRKFEQAVLAYKIAFHSWQRDNPIEMSEVNDICLDVLNDVPNQHFETFITLVNNRPENELLFYRAVAGSVLSVYLAIQLGFEKKEWIQIGSSALLRDSGKTKFDKSFINHENLTENELERFRQHPIFSYQLVEHLMTLTQRAKLGILQHHEHLDGTGYPGKTMMEKIHPYGRIIAVSDYFYKLMNTTEINVIIDILETKKDEKFSALVVNQLVNDLKKMEPLTI